MEILKEITPDWAVDSRPPNHTYLLNNKGQIIAFARYHANDIDILKSRIYLDKRYRKFVKDNHSGLSKLIPQFQHEDNIKKEKDIIPAGARVFKVKSKEKEYQVILKNNQLSCSCTGFGFRRKCKHVDAVAKIQQSTKMVKNTLDNSATI